MHEAIIKKTENERCVLFEMRMNHWGEEQWKKQIRYHEPSHQMTAICNDKQRRVLGKMNNRISKRKKRLTLIQTSTLCINAWLMNELLCVISLYYLHHHLKVCFLFFPRSIVMKRRDHRCKCGVWAMCILCVKSR